MSQAGRYVTTTGPGAVVQTISGNTGTAVPVAGDIAIVTANSTPIFAAAGKTVTLDFNLTTNLALGSSLPALTTGNSNVFLGGGSGTNVTSALASTFVGYAAGFTVSSSPGNTGLGDVALYTIGTGLGENIAVGRGALQFLATGAYNTTIGGLAGNTYAGAESSNISIGYNVTGTLGESNTLRIGRSAAGPGQLTKAFVAGIDGVDVGAATVKVVSMGTAATANQLGTVNLVAGAGVTITPSSNQIQISATGADILAYTAITVADSPYTVLSTDEYISVNSAGGPVTIRFPNAATTGRVYYVKDRTASAVANNITLTTVGGAVNIDGATTYVMNSNYQAVSLIGNSTSYEIF